MNYVYLQVLKLSTTLATVLLLSLFTSSLVFATTTPTSTPATVVTESTATRNDPSIIIEQVPGTDIQIGDFVVGPGRAEVTVAPGETVVREITITNRIDDNRTFQFTIEDMSGSTDGKEAAVLLGDQNGPYSLKDYVSLPNNRITLNLGERARIPVSITMPPNAEPGGYYGAVLASTIQDPGADSGSGARSPIVARIGTLLFINVPGPAERGSELIDFSTRDGSRFFTSGPVDFVIAHENTGSVHLNPYGELRITNMLGAEVGFVELDPWFVLPKSIRTREVTWNNEFLVGRYAVTASINRGYDDLVDSKTFYIWVLPWKIVLSVFGTLFVMFLLLRLFFSRFEFKRK